MLIGEFYGVVVVGNMNTVGPCWRATMSFFRPWRRVAGIESCGGVVVNSKDSGVTIESFRENANVVLKIQSRFIPKMMHGGIGK